MNIKETIFVFRLISSKRHGTNRNFWKGWWSYFEKKKNKK